MTERLTEKIMVSKDGEILGYRIKPFHERQATQKLAEYETAEEDGRLVILPCKIGTIVYAIRQSWHGYVIDKKRFSYGMIDKVGRLVFFTCEEAEKALEERNDT